MFISVRWPVFTFKSQWIGYSLSLWNYFISLFLPADSMEADIKYFCENSGAIPSMYRIFGAVSVTVNEMIFDSSYFSLCAEL